MNVEDDGPFKAFILQLTFCNLKVIETKALNALFILMLTQTLKQCSRTCNYEMVQLGLYDHNTSY